MSDVYVSATAVVNGSGSLASPKNSYNNAYAVMSDGDRMMLAPGHCFDPVNSFFSRIKKSITVTTYGLDSNLTTGDKLANYPMLDGMAYEPPDAGGWTYEGDGVWSKPFGFAAPKRMFAGATKTGVLLSQRSWGVPYSRSPNATADNLTAIKDAIVATDDIWHPAGSALDYRVFVYTGTALQDPADYYNGLGFVTADGTSLGGGGNEGIWVSATSGVLVEKLQVNAMTNGSVVVTSLASESVGTDDVTISDVFAHCVWNQGFSVGPKAENTATLQKLVSNVTITNCTGDSTSAATEQDRSVDYTNTAYLDMFNIYDRISNVRVEYSTSINSGHTGMAMGCGGNNHFEPVNSGFFGHTVTFASWCSYARGLATSRCGSGCYVYQCTIDGQNVRSQCTSGHIVANAWTNMRPSIRKPGTDQWLFVEAYITQRDIPLAGADQYVYVSVSDLVIANNVALLPKNTGATNAPFVITTYDSGFAGAGYPDPDIEPYSITFANNILEDSEERFWCGAYQNAGGGSIGFQNFWNNIIFNGEVSPQIKWLGTLYDTNSLTGAADNLFSDPMLSADLIPQPGSPAIGAGKYIGAYADMSNAAFANPPSIGVYEIGSSPDDGGGSGGGGGSGASSSFGIQINALRDEDTTDAGFYAAACGTASGWRGCGVYKSTDGGTNYTAVGAIINAVTGGYVVGDPLGDFAGGSSIPDEINQITVRLYGSSMSLSTVSYSQFIDGVQAALIGSEIVYYRSAVLNDDGTYTLSGFLRGRRGSEYAIPGHVSGERFVALSVATINRIAAPTSDIGRTTLFKAVTVGGQLGTTPAKSFTNEGACLRPYAPVILGGGRYANGDLVLTWVRRDKTGGEWRDNIDVPLSEASEAYEVDILDADGAVVRTISATTSTATYTSEEQTEDFGEPQAAVTWKVRQMSAVVGSGYSSDPVTI